LVQRIGAQGLFRPAEEGMMLMTTRRANGTFVTSPGRPRGARNRLASRVFEDIFAHWSAPAAPGSELCKGQEALETLYKEKPGEYLRLTASVLPKEFVFENVVSDLDDDQIDDLLAALRQRMVETRAATLLVPPSEKEVVN
jgi:hypothetical protein